MPNSLKFLKAPILTEIYLEYGDGNFHLKKLKIQFRAIALILILSNPHGALSYE